jgi:DNA-binding response OmpR family regulator
MSNTQARIMVVEDDETIALGLTAALRHAGHEVRRYDRAEIALDELKDWEPHLMVLDRMLPGVDGLTALKYIRASSPGLQVIMLTAKGTETDRVEGLDAGADDYVAKPFSIKELLARVRARLRDLPAEEPQNLDEFTFGEVKADLRRRVLHRKGEEIRLTTHEAGVLSYLISHRGKDVTREELLEKVWGYSPTMQTRTVDNQILKLRKKIEDVPADPRHILTIHGVGYRFEP